MAKNTPSVFRVKIQTPGPVTLKGTIQSLSPGRALVFHYKKPRSSKWALRTVAWKDLISYEGEQGKSGSVTFHSPRSVVRTVKGTVEIDEKLNLAIVTTEDGETINVKPEFMEAEADDDIDAPSFAKASKKKVVEEEEPKKKKKKA